jgi:hypothetical protein
MGVRFPSVQSNVLINNNSSTNVEQVIVTTPPLTLPLDFAAVVLFWYIIHTVGATAAGFTVRLRRGTTVGGTVINVATQQTAAAGNNAVSSGFYFDTPGAVAGQQYSLTLIDNGSTAGGTIQDASLLAFAL